MSSEAKARIKINRLLEKSGWRFFDTNEGPANITLEGYTKLTQKDIDAFGEDFEHVRPGFMDFLLLDELGFPFIVLEAKAEEKSPLDGKEQARRYAQSQNVRFVILSNGNLHYFWDLERGNPDVITEFPRLDSLKHRQQFIPNPQKLPMKSLGMTTSPHPKIRPSKPIPAGLILISALIISQIPAFEFCAIIKRRPFTPCRNRQEKATTVFSSRWLPAPGKR